MKEILILNGPNLNLTGKREKDKYGCVAFEDYLKSELIPYAKKRNFNISYFQSNHEGDIIDKIHDSNDKIDYIVINPGALTHYSYAIHDAIKSIDVEVIEVHITNIFNREQWRNKSVISPAVKAIISGFGLDSYRLAINYIVESNGHLCQYDE